MCPLYVIRRIWGCVCKYFYMYMISILNVWSYRCMEVERNDKRCKKKKKSQSMSGDFVFWKVILNIADLIDVVYVLSLIHWFVKNQKGFSYMTACLGLSTETDDERFTCTIHWISWVCVEKFVSFKINASISNTVLFMVIFLFKTPTTRIKRYIKKFIYM